MTSKLDALRNKVKTKSGGPSEKLNEPVTINESARVTGTLHVEDDSGNPNPDGMGFRAIQWFDVVRADRSKIADAAEYYKQASQDALRHTVPIGNLGHLVAETPGLAHFYKTIHTDAQQIRRWLEERYEIELAQKYTWFMTSQEAKAEFGKIGTTDAQKFAKADDSLAALADDVRLMAYCDHLLDDVNQCFDNRGYTLHNLVTIYNAKLEAVWIDPTKETSNK